MARITAPPIGRTTAVARITAHAIGRTTAVARITELLFGVFDPRPGLEDVVPDDYLGGYAGSSAVASSSVLPWPRNCRCASAAGTTRRSRAPCRWWSWWTTTACSPPAAPPARGRLASYLPMAAELDLNVIPTRMVRGASRGMYGKPLQTIQTYLNPGIVPG